MEQKNVAIVGLGYVGLPLALLAAHKGYRVYGIDIQASKVELLRKGESPITDPVIKENLRTVPKDLISFGTDYTEVKDASIIVICVPTPVRDNHTPDLGPVENAARGIAAHLRAGSLIILESTVNPGVSEDVILPILEKASGLKGGKDFDLAHCPERINPGDPKWRVENIPRVVGSLTEEGLKRAVEFYESIIENSITPMGSLKEAEAVKIVENSFRDINIAFVNELAMSFSRLGIDVIEVIKGASTKPFAFMAHYPSCGVGGHCIPVDPYYLIEYAQKNGFHHDFLSLARRINNKMPEFTVEQLILALNKREMAIKGSVVAVLGLAYKPNIDDCRESPAFHVIKELERHEAKVRVFDPHVPSKSTVQNLDEALEGADAVVIVTAHDEFRALTPEALAARKVKVMVDGCNCLDKNEFAPSPVTYAGIGR
jgi:UDP-N-acetyl-D-glucosamine dehydrogenase